MLGSAKPAGVMNTDLSLPCTDLEIIMSIKGLKEALVKKRQQQQPARNADGTVDNNSPGTHQRHTNNRPEKRAAGRGR